MWKAALAVGAYLAVFTGGAPWSGTGVGTAVVGRPAPWPMPVTLLLHFALCFAVIGLVALAVYRLNLWWAVPVGIVVAALAGAINVGVLPGAPVDEARVISAHVVLGLFGTVAYKGLSVPRRRVDRASS